MRTKYPGGNVRLILKVREEIVRALRVRAAAEGTTMSAVVTTWVRTWTKAPGRRRGERA